MSMEAPTNVVFVPGLYWNLPGVGERNRQANNIETVGALQAALGELAIVDLHDADYHGEGTPEEKEEKLDSRISGIADQTGQPVLVAGSSLGGNLAFGAALRLGSEVVTRGLAISAPLRAEGSPPPGLRLGHGDDVTFVENTMKRLEEARPEDLSRLTSVYGVRDIFVKPEWSQWDGIDTHTVPGFWHPRIIQKTLSNRGLMQSILLA